MAVVLTGFMASGKTTVGRRLAARLAWGFVDTDDVVEARLGLSPAHLITSGREDDLRREEGVALRDALRTPRVVVATGGSTLLHPGEMAWCKEHARVYHLEASPHTLQARMGDPSTRPRWGEDWPQLLAQRLPLYHLAHMSVDTSELSLAQVVEHLHADLAPILLAHTLQPVYLRPGELSALGRTLSSHLPHCRRALLVSCPQVMAHHGAPVRNSLEAAGLEVHTTCLPRGDEAKTWRHLGELLDEMIRLQLDRSTVVVALGGGAVGDITGLAASLCRRGIPWVQIPTTLLAQVDAGLGGKTAINHARGKNLIGSFHLPTLVWIDPHLLNTLTSRELRSGLGEVVKYGAVGDPSLWEVLESIPPGHLPGGEVLNDLITRCVDLKQRLVELDERDTGPRQVLNFGHTLGHTLELGSNLLHGEAIAMGMVFACALSERQCGLDPAVRRRLVNLLHHLGLTTSIPGIPWPEVQDRLLQDKKVHQSRSRWVLLTTLGQPLLKQVALSDVEVLYHELSGRSAP